MVLVDRNAENIRNGRRSRGSSPNGAHGLSPEDSSDDDNSTKKNGTKTSTKGKNEFEEKIRVGKDYQVVCPDLIPINDRKPEQLNDRALLVWSPTKDIPETKLDEYISVAKEKYGYNGEQALGMLFWHKHDLERAVLDLANFTPFPDEWTVEDKVLFEQAFQFHGKSFHRIRQMLPDKTIASLVKYYYSWKKTRSRSSVMDRQEKKKNDGGSENGSENGSNDDSENEDKKWPIHRGIRRCSRSPTNRASNSAQNCPTNNSTNTNNTINNYNKNGSIQSNFPHVSNDNNNGTSSNTKTPTLNQQTASASMNKQGSTANESKKEENNNVNKDAGYSSSSSSTSGQQNSSNSTLNCTNCGVLCNELKRTVSGSFCYSCYHHWRRTGALRPTSGPSYLGTRSGRKSHPKTGQLYFYHGYHDGASNKHKRKPPKGMYINHDDVVKLATQSKMMQNALNSNSVSNFPNSSTGSNISLLTSSQQTINNSFPQIISSENHPDDLLASMDREIVSLLSQIQTNKQKISSVKGENSGFNDDSEESVNLFVKNNSSRWTTDDSLLAVKCFRKYGKNFQVIAETLGNKTEAQVRQFFSNSRRKLSLDAIIKEHDEEKQKQKEQEQGQRQEADGNDDKNPSNNPSTSSFLIPQFVIDTNNAKSKTINHNDIVMEIDLDDDNQMPHCNEQIGNIDEIIGVNSSIKNTEKKVPEEDEDIPMEVIDDDETAVTITATPITTTTTKSNSSKLLPVKKNVVEETTITVAATVTTEAAVEATTAIEPITTTIIDVDEEEPATNNDEVVKMDTTENNEEEDEEEEEERPSVSIIPIPKDSTKTTKVTEDTVKVVEKPEVELIDTSDHTLKPTNINASAITIN